MVGVVRRINRMAITGIFNKDREASLMLAYARGDANALQLAN